MTAQRAKWAFSGTAEASDVPYWMVVAPGREGVAHSFVNFLASCADAGHPEPDGSIPFHREDGVVDEIAYSRGLPADVVIAELDRLVADGIVDRRTDPDGFSWCRATPPTIAAHAEAYAERHPMTTEHPNPPVPPPFPDVGLARAMLAAMQPFWALEGVPVGQAEIASAGSRRIAAEGDLLPSFNARTSVPALELVSLTVRFTGDDAGGEDADTGPWANVGVRFATSSNVQFAPGHRPSPERERELRAELTQRDMTDDLGLMAAETHAGEAAVDRDGMMARLTAAQQQAADSVRPAEVVLDGRVVPGFVAQVGDYRVVWCDGPGGETVSCLTHRWPEPVRLVASRDYVGLLGDRPDLG